jgi:AcrR family transcriptional regulator
MRERKEPAERKQELLEVAIHLAKEVGYSHITRNEVARRAGVAYGLVTLYFKTIENLKRLVVKEAIKREIVQILAQALARKETLTRKLNPDLLEKVIRHLSK